MMIMLKQLLVSRAASSAAHDCCCCCCWALAHLHTPPSCHPGQLARGPGGKGVLPVAICSQGDRQADSYLLAVDKDCTSRLSEAQ
jgi:hypothetical protein